MATKKKEKKTGVTSRGAGAGRAFIRDGKGFIIPKREFKELERRGKTRETLAARGEADKINKDLEKEKTIEKEKEKEEIITNQKIKKSNLNFEEQKQKEDMNIFERTRAVIRERGDVTEDMNIFERASATSPFNPKQTGEAGLLMGLGLAASSSLGTTFKATGTGVKTIKTIKNFNKVFTKDPNKLVITGKEVLVKIGNNNFGKTTTKSLYGLGALYAINEFALSPSELATWAAVDNIAGQAAFLTRDIVDAVKFNDLSFEQANELFNTAEESISKSKKFVNTTTILNPKLWANRKILMAAIREAEKRVEFSRNEVFSFKTPQETKQITTNPQNKYLGM